MDKLCLAILCLMIMTTEAQRPVYDNGTFFISVTPRCETDGVYTGKLPGGKDVPNCVDCSCSKGSEYVSCCYNVVLPGGFDEEKCEIVFDEVACTKKVVEKANHENECLYLTLTGR